MARASSFAQRIQAFLDARPPADNSESSDIILTVHDPDPMRGRWLHLTASDLRDLLAQNERLQQQNEELFSENHELQYGPTMSAEDWEADGGV